jgi:MFS family permease
VLPRLLHLGVITFMFNLGGGVIAPAVPLYARSLGADYRDLGLIGAAHGLAFAALTLPLGRASDRFGRRALLLVSALAVGAAAACYLVSTGVAGLIVGKLLEAAGWAAFWPALEAWVAEGFAGRAGSAMGVGYSAYAAAFVFGSSAAGFIIQAAGLRAPFVAYLGTAAFALVLILLAPGSHATSSRPHSAPPGARPASARDAGREPRLLAYGTGFVYVFGLGTVLAFLPAYAADRGLTPAAVGLLFGSYWVARFVASLAAGHLSDRAGHRAVLLPALLVSAGSALLIAAPAGVPLLALGTMGLGLTAGACAPTCIGLIADHVAPADRGTAMGLFEAACGVSILLAGFVGGQVAEGLSPAAPYVLVSALALAWAAVLARRLPHRTVSLAN